MLPALRLAVSAALVLLVVACQGTPPAGSPPTATPPAAPATASPTVAAAPTPAPATAAPTAPATSSTAPTGTLTIDLTTELESLDPYLAYHVDGLSVHHNLFDYLVERDREGRIAPGLAESWRVVDDTTLEFQLRQGVMFHNGEPFTADSVKFSVERMLDPQLGSGVRSNFASIKEVKVVGPYTVQLLLSQPDSRLLDNLTNQLAMLPPAYTRQVGNDGFAKHPVGTGPFSFVEWLRDDHLTLAANERYWSGSVKGRPLVKTVVFRPVPSVSTRVADLRSGRADIVAGLGGDQAREIQAAGGARVEQANNPGYQYVFFNTLTQGTPLQDKRVRQALNYAVDRESIVRSLLGGFGQPLTQAVGPLTPGYDPSLAGFAYDPARARALLQEAGYPNGLDLTLDVTAKSAGDVVDAVAAQLGQVGVRTKIQTFETGVFNDRWVKKTVGDLVSVTWATLADPGVLNLLAGCDGFLALSCSEAAQPFLAQGLATMDQTRRAQIYQQAIRALNEEPFAIYLFGLASVYGVADRVEGWQPSVSGYLYATEARVR